MAQSQKRIWFWWQNSHHTAQSMFQDDEKIQIKSLRETEENIDVNHTWSLCTFIPYRLQKFDHENIVSFAQTAVLQHAVPCFQLTLPLATFLHSRSNFWPMLWQLKAAMEGSHTFSTQHCSELYSEFSTMILLNSGKSMCSQAGLPVHACSSALIPKEQTSPQSQLDYGETELPFLITISWTSMP